MSEKKCPFFSLGKDGFAINCGPDCAMYANLHDYECCAILSIAISLHDISIDMAEISEKMKIDDQN